MKQQAVSDFSLILQNKAGVFLVDKPSGPTSHDVVNWARKLVNIRTVGHTGTLDPLASGLLILLVGREQTKRQAEFLKLDKKYLVTGRLGVVTDSYDVTGKVVSQSSNWAQLTKEDLKKALTKLVGKIEQIVPVYSAVKVKGKKLYKLARTGQTALGSLPSRQVAIHSIELTSFTPPDFSLAVYCGSGTYVRSLIHDIGQTLGVGATVIALRRTAIGQMSIDQAQVCPYLFKR